MAKEFRHKKLMDSRASLIIGVFSLGINLSPTHAAGEVSPLVQEIMNTLASKGPEGTCKEGGVFRRSVAPPKGSKGIMKIPGGACSDLKIAALALLTCSDYKDPDKKKTPFEKSGCGKISTQMFAGKGTPYQNAKQFLADAIREKEPNVRAFVCQTPIGKLNQELKNLRRACTQSTKAAPASAPLPSMKEPVAKEPATIEEPIEFGRSQGKLTDLNELKSLTIDMMPVQPTNSAAALDLSPILKDDEQFLNDILLIAQGSSKDKATKEAISRIKKMNRIIRKGTDEQKSDLIKAVEGLSETIKTLGSKVGGEIFKPKTTEKLNIKDEISKSKEIDELIGSILNLRILFEVENKILSVVKKEEYYSTGIKDTLEKAKENITLNDHEIGTIANELMIFSKASEQLHPPLSKAGIHKEIAEIMTIIMIDYEMHEIVHNPSPVRKEAQKILDEVHEWLKDNHFNYSDSSQKWEAPSETPTPEGEIEKQASKATLPQDTKQILEKLDHNKPVKSEEVLHLVEEADEQLTKATELGLTLEFSHNEDEKKEIQKRITEINQGVALLVNSVSKKGVEKLQGPDQQKARKSLTQIEKKMSKEGFAPDENEQYHPPHSTIPLEHPSPTSQKKIEKEIEEHLAEPDQLAPNVKQILEKLDHNKLAKSEDILDLVEEVQQLVLKTRGDLSLLEIILMTDEPKAKIKEVEDRIAEMYDNITLLVNNINHKGWQYLEEADKKTAGHLLDDEIEPWMRSVGFKTGIDENGTEQWYSPHSVKPLEHELSDKGHVPTLEELEAEFLHGGSNAQKEPEEMHDDEREKSIQHFQEKFPNMPREEIEKVVDTPL